jgi:hypothetical protein
MIDGLIFNLCPVVSLRMVKTRGPGQDGHFVRCSKGLLNTPLESLNALITGVAGLCGRNTCQRNGILMR